MAVEKAPTATGGATATATETRAEHHHQDSVTAPSRAGLWVMGLVGGLVPSPAALLLLLGAIALGEAVFGVLMVVAFGVGMATSLAVVGVLARDLLLRAEQYAARTGRLTRPVRTVLTYGAATGVVVVGLGILVRAALQVG